MTSVFTLLTLPKTSKGLSQIRSTVVDSIDDGSASPRHKVARLDTDSDSASASRSKPTQKTRGPIKIEVIGEHVKGTTETNRQFTLVRGSIRTILSREQHNTLRSPYEGIYSACRSIVTVGNNGEGLYDCLKLELEQAIGRLVIALTSHAGPGIPRIAFFVEICKWFETKIALLVSLLTYLDQVYIVKYPKVLSIHDLAYSQFSYRIFGNRQIVENLHADLDKWFSWERQYKMEHEGRTTLQSLVDHLLKHGQYGNFEDYYVENTRSVCAADSAEEAEAKKEDPKGFFKYITTRIDDEVERSKAVLPVNSWGRLRETVERALWDGRLEWLANDTLGLYMDANDITTLAMMYTHLSRVGGTKALCVAFRKHIQASVESIVKDSAHDEDMVQRLLDLKSMADTTISSAFVDEPVAPPTTKPAGSTSALLPKVPNHDFAYALSDAFSIGFKARRNKPAEMIAKYLDKAMRKGQGTTSDAQFETLLDSALALYRFTDDKDVFRTFYHRSLAKRLLLEKSASDDFEAAMLKKLKEKYDPEFGMGEDMFKDLALSREAMREYHSKLPDRDSPGHKLNVMVLQRSAWPFTVQKASVDLPAGMQEELTNFEKYYKEKHSGHTLDWDHALGTATLRAQFNPGTKELSVSLYQTVVLLLFNYKTEIFFQEIKEETRMDDAELRRTLQSLACGKKKVLKKIPAGREVDDGDVFRYNADFDDPRAKVHINSIQAKVSPEESRRANVSIEGDRKHYLDAAIVRIMKAKKELTYEQLKAATIDAVKGHFVPQVDVIKKRIDVLVETDYLERSKEDKSKFFYVA